MRDTCGRGFIQLTGKANYREHGLAIGEPLLAGFIKAKERQVKEALVGEICAERGGW